MSKNKSVKIFIVAAVIITTAAAFCTIACGRAPNKSERSNAALGINGEPVSTQVVQSNKNGDKNETAGKNVSKTVSDNGVIEIREKMFATQVSDVYVNTDDYLGKTIKLEGIFQSAQSYEKEKPYCFVIRYGPGGCCGYDANVGFEVKWNTDRAQPYPAPESWVEAAGELKYYEEDDFQYLYLDLLSLNVLSKRGAATVWQ
jgi:uncharacterized membrane protein YcgQ (UPF0703/DUF1980 family)